MNSYRITLRPLSPWASPWHADTLFGSLCWKMRLTRGESALVRWLAGFRDGTPPFVLSDAFPEGYLPAPIGLEYGQSAQKVRRPYLISEADFRSLAVGRLPSNAVQLFTGHTTIDSTRLMVSLGRESVSAEFGGALFEQPSTFVSAGHPRLQLYFRSQNPSEFEEILSLVAWTGFGKKSSSGFGAFEIVGPATRCEWLDIAPSSTAFVTLCHFVPAPEDPPNGRWRTHIKYPKYHSQGVVHPLKGRLVTLTPGSNFRLDTPARAWYGRMIDMPVGDIPAVHYGLAFAAPFAWTA